MSSMKRLICLVAALLTASAAAPIVVSPAEAAVAEPELGETEATSELLGLDIATLQSDPKSALDQLMTTMLQAEQRGQTSAIQVGDIGVLIGGSHRWWIETIQHRYSSELAARTGRSLKTSTDYLVLPVTDDAGSEAGVMTLYASDEQVGGLLSVGGMNYRLTVDELGRLSTGSPFPSPDLSDDAGEPEPDIAVKEDGEPAPDPATVVEDAPGFTGVTSRSPSGQSDNAVPASLNKVSVMLVTSAGSGTFPTLQAKLDAMAMDIVLANATSANSGSPTDFELVYLDWISTTLGQNVQAALAVNSLQDPNDTRLDEVHQLRDLYGADLVVLYHDVQGLLAKVYDVRETNAVFSEQHKAFAVINTDLAGTFVPTHEIGHLMGAGHENHPGGALDADSLAFSGTIQGPFGPIQYGSVVHSGSSSSLQRLFYWSTPSPSVTPPYSPIGTGSRENERAVTATDSVTRQYRYSTVDFIDIAGGDNGNDYYTVTSRGKVVGYGGAPHHGDAHTLGLTLNRPIVGIEADDDGSGYYLVASDGGIFAFNAPFHGSAGGISLNEPIVDMAVNPDGAGYWLVAADGGVFSYGATFHGSAAPYNPSHPVVAIDGTTAGANGGYVLATSDGAIYAFGGATHHGGANGSGWNSTQKPIVDVAIDDDGVGYYLMSWYGETTNYSAAAKTDYAGNDSNPVVGIDTRDDGHLLAVKRQGQRKQL